VVDGNTRGVLVAAAKQFGKVQAGFSSELPVSERIRKVLQPQWDEFEYLFNTVELTPLKLQRFHRLVKALGSFSVASQ